MVLMRAGFASLCLVRFQPLDLGQDWTWINPTPLVRLDDPGSISVWAWTSVLHRSFVFAYFLLCAPLDLVFYTLVCPKLFTKILKFFLCVLNTSFNMFVTFYCAKKLREVF